MEDMNSKVLSGYGLKLISSTRNRTGFVCKTDKGYKEVKKNNSGEKALIFQSEAKQHLKNRGFQNVTTFSVALDGNPFYSCDGNLYVVEDYIDSREIELNQNDMLLNATRTLARMHIASQGFDSEIKKTNIGKLPILYEKRKNELTKIKKWISSQSHLSEMDLIVLKNYGYYKKKVNEAIEILCNSRYQSLMEEAERERCFCHNAFKGENLRLTQQGTLQVSGFHKCAYDYCILDLAEFIRRYLKENDADVETVDSILKEYDKIRTVTPDDLELIYAILTYPYKFLKLCNEYYNKRRVYVSDAIVQKMNQCITQSAKCDEIIEGLRGI